MSGRTVRMVVALGVVACGALDAAHAAEETGGFYEQARGWAEADLLAKQVVSAQIARLN